MRSVLVPGLSAACILFARPAAMAQTPAPSPAPAQAFEAVSIQPYLPPAGGRMEACNPHGDAITLRYVGCPLKVLVKLAYDLKDVELVWKGPGWGETDRYVIEARSPTPATPAQMMLMLQPVLADRFRLRFRREERMAPAYSLKTVGQAPKLKPAEKTDNCGEVMVRPGMVTADCVTIGDIAELLQDEIVKDRPVIDATGLPAAGRYQMQLQFGDDESGPSIFSALPEQLGLKLQAGQREQQFLVVTNASRPTGN